jgi:hypothetical protein
MTSTSAEATALLQDRLREIVDRADIAQLCDRYILHLDRDRDSDEWLPSVFTADAHLTFPFGEYRGMAGLAEFQQMARTNVERTQHISSNYDITVSGDTAAVRAHLTAVHVLKRENPGVHFVIGGHYEATAIRTPEGWRFRRLVFDLVWNVGHLPGGHPGEAGRDRAGQA